MAAGRGTGMLATEGISEPLLSALEKQVEPPLSDGSPAATRLRVHARDALAQLPSEHLSRVCGDRPAAIADV